MDRLQTIISVIAAILGLFFFIAGARKLFTDWEWARQGYLRHNPLWIYHASGVIELCGGLGLIWEPTRFGSAIGILIMIALVAAHPWRGPWQYDVKQTLIPAVSTILVAAVAWFSRPR